MATTTTKEMHSIMRIEDIRLMEKFTFWLERLAILTQVFCLRLPGPQLLVFSCPKYLLLATALLLIVTNSIFLALSIERQFIRQFFFEPEAIFCIERPAMLLLVLHYVVPGGYIYGAIISLIVLVLTNYVMINRYFNSDKSQTNTTLHAKETSKDGVKDEGLKEKSWAETIATNIMGSVKLLKDAIMSAASLYLFEEVDKKSNEIESAEVDESTELSGNSESFCACDLDSKEKNKKDVEKKEERIFTDGVDQHKEEDKDLCFEAEKKEDVEVLAMEEDQVVKEAEADNQSWVNVSESVDEEDDDDDVSSWEETDEEDDDDSSWEETDEVDEETQDDEEEDDDDDDESILEETNLVENEESSCKSWEKVQIINGGDGNVGGDRHQNHGAATEIASFSEQRKTVELGKETEHEDEEENSNISWQQEKKELTEKLELATQKWMKYEKDCSILSDFLSADLNLPNNIDADELEKLKQEKDELETKLDYAYEFMEDERKIWEERIRVLRDHLTVTLDAIQCYRSMEQDFDEERRKWEDEKMALNFTVSNADENVQYCQTLVNIFSSWYQSSINGLIAEGNEMSSNLSAANALSESYKTKLDQSEEHCLYYKTCFEEYEEKCQILKEENLNLVSKINTETSLAERYEKFAKELYRACMRGLGDLDS